MTLLFISLIAGALTILAPCVLPLLPVIIGGSVSDAHSTWKPYVITASLGLSVVLFTLLLKASTALINIPPQTWSILSGGILIVFGVTMLFPMLWAKISTTFSSGGAHTLLATGAHKKSFTGDILIGAALGPVFTSCSPTYAVIIATVLPQSFAQGFIYLLAYAAGLCGMLLLVALLGQKLTKRLAGAADPQGWFKRGLGILFLIVGVAILFGYDKVFEARLLEAGVYDGIGTIEGRLLENGEN